MKTDGKRILICSCEGTMPLDRKALATALAGAEVSFHNHLCRAEIEDYQNALGDGRELLVACTQEAPLFGELAEEAEGAAVGYANIRERAGWSEQASRATPKILALLAEAALERPINRAVTLSSEGRVLVYGPDGAALEAARQLGQGMDVHCLLTTAEDVLPPALTETPLFRGRIAAAQGHLGAFVLHVDGFAPMKPSSRGAADFDDPKDGVELTYDIVLDLTRGSPLFAGGGRRDGYFAPDPRNPAQVQKALFDIVNLVGEFDKPRYVKHDPNICVHARNGLVGCSRCLDLCPLGAIAPAGDYVEIDPRVCAGCGACAGACPTGAVTYDYPAEAFLFERLRTLLGAYRDAGGEKPEILVHDGRHGEAMISAMARLGRGLPANVLPFAVNEVTQLGLDFLTAALAFGASRVLVLAGPDKRDELDGLRQQVELSEAVMTGLGYGGERAAILEETDPEALESVLHERSAPAPPEAASFLVMGGKRSTMALALGHLHGKAPDPVDVLALPAGAPFGTAEVATEGCTLCLSCVSACPVGAFQDDPDKPRISFVESACVQCGLCRVTCPEKVITLVPRLNFTEEARRPVVKYEEEPFACVRCGQPFGVKSSVERMVEKLSGHVTFADEGALDRIRMCADCRVVDQFERADDPFAAGPRHRPRTTDDYLAEPDGEADAEPAGEES